MFDFQQFDLVELSSLEIRMARSENLPVLPQAVGAVLKLADDPNANQKDLEKAFEKDPAITAKILKVANSSFYGGVKVPSIGRAISFLGATTIRSLVVGIAFQQVSTSKSSVMMFDKEDFWRHSLAVAVACRILGKLKAPARSEELYCTGMLHDIGILVLDRFVPDMLDEAMRNAKQFGLQLHEAEEKVLGYNHAQVGGLLATRWGLSDVMARGIEYHHNPTKDDKCYETTSLVAAANILAYDAGYGNQGQTLRPEDRAILDELNLPEDQVPVVMQVIQTEVSKTCEAFSIAA